MRTAEGQSQRKRERQKDRAKEKENGRSAESGKTERNSRNAGWKDGKKKRANLMILCYNKK